MNNKIILSWIYKNCKFAKSWMKRHRFAMTDDELPDRNPQEFEDPQQPAKPTKIVKYPFSRAKRDSQEGWYLDWKALPGDIFTEQGRTSDINALQNGDMVEDSVASSVPYWRIGWVDANIGRVYVEPIEPNPFLNNVGAGGKELNEHDYEVHSGDYEKKKVDEYLDLVRSGKYSDIRDITYLLKGTVPVNFGPNGAQGGWYNASDVRSNRGGQQNIDAKTIMMNDAKTIQQKLKLDVPPAALSGEMSPREWTDFVNGDYSLIPSTALNGENWNDPAISSNFVMNHPQPQIKLRNFDAIMNVFNPFPRQQINKIWQEEQDSEVARSKSDPIEAAFKRGDFMRQDIKSQVHQLTLDIASLKHPTQDKTGFDPYYLLKEKAMSYANQFGWSDVIDAYVNSHDEDNRAEAARILGQNKQIDKLLQMEAREKHPKALIGIIRGLREARYPLSKIFQNPKYRNLGDDYYSKELLSYINQYQ